MFSLDFRPTEAGAEPILPAGGAVAEEESRAPGSPATGRTIFLLSSIFGPMH
jgi:hypothetical protein